MSVVVRATPFIQDIVVKTLYPLPNFMDDRAICAPGVLVNVIHYLLSIRNNDGILER